MSTNVPMANTLARCVLDARKKRVEQAEAKVLLAILNHRGAIAEGRPIDGDLIDDFKAATRFYELAIGALNEEQSRVDEILRGPNA